MSTPRIIVVGGGMAGLSAAWECQRRGLDVSVLEASPDVGGVVRTVRDGDLVLDGGPDAFLFTKPGARTLCDELGLSSELVSMLPPRGASILVGDAFHPLPEGGAFGVPVRARAFLTSGLLSWRGKLRVAAEPLRPRRATSPDADESAGAFFRRRFGEELTERIAQPLLGGIHAGRLDSLSARAVVPQLVVHEQAGRSVWLSLRRQATVPPPDGVFRSFVDGMGRLPAALAAALPAGTIATGRHVTAIGRDETTFRVHVADVEAPLVADVLLLAVPAWQAARLLESLAPDAADLCRSVPYVSSATALLAYPGTAFTARPAGSGYVIATRGSDPVMAVTWVTGKWPGRAPTGTTLVRVFFGGEGHEADLTRDDQSLVEAGHAHLARWWGAASPPSSSRVFRWPNASPQHVVGHPGRVRALDRQLDVLGALGVAGSGFRAIGIPDVIADAREAIARLIGRWQAR